MQVLLSSIVQSGTAPLLALNMLPDEERVVVLEQFNNTAAECDTSRCVHEVFQQFAHSTPEVRALLIWPSYLMYTVP